MNRLTFNAACVEENFNVLNLLINEGICNKIKTDALFSLSQRNKINVLTYLINKGVDINVKLEINGDTPLHCAAAFGHYEVVQLLLNSGADKNIKNKFGMTPLTYAKNNNHTEIINLLNEI
jgi:ankyrin repeat protein